MLKIKQKIAEKITEQIATQFQGATIETDTIVSMFEYPPETSMGDIALPCFKLSKNLHRAPVQIAGLLAESVKDECVERVENVNGYLNFYISNEYLGNVLLRGIVSLGERYGSQTLGEGKTVVLDYSSPNVAKPFHIGHLGTTVIGHALKKLHEFVGYKCVGINYLGDWGTQFGKMIVAYRKWGNHDEIEAGGVDKLVEFMEDFRKTNG